MSSFPNSKNQPRCATVKSAPLLCMLLLIAFSGCGLRAENVTAKFDGRRVGACDAEGGYLAYLWTPAQHMSTQGHLVLLDQLSGAETELVADLSGPWAMGDGRVVWWNALLRDEEGKSDVIVYDIEAEEKFAIARVKTQALEADGGHVAWIEPLEHGSVVVLHDLETAQQRIISPAAAEGETIFRSNLKFDGGTVAWTAMNASTRKSRIEALDVATGKLSTIDIPQETSTMSVSEGRLVYRLSKGEIHLYDMADGTDRVIASVDRLAGPPYIEGDKIAWCEHVTKERFKGIPGQPLYDEKDICDVFVYDINSGKKRLVAEYLLSNGHVSLHNGRAYLSVYREYPPPGASNLVVPVDLWVW